MVKLRKSLDGALALATSSLQILSENETRKYACIYNASAVGIWLAFGKAAVAGRGVYLAPGGHYEIDGDNLWVGAVNGIAASGTGNAVSVQEFC